MKLNNDCVRDILIQVEEVDLGCQLTIEELKSKLPEYTEEDIIYSCLKLEEANFLELDKGRYFGDKTYTIHQIKDITYQGHEFLNTIRNNDNWNKIKSISKNVGASSLKAIYEIGSQLVSNIILNQLSNH